MNHQLATLLTSLYPRSWRGRYGAEFEEVLKAGPGDFRTVANVLWSGLRERIVPIVGPTSHRDSGSGQFHSLCIRAPWVIFSLAPVSLLAVCYMAACLILWTGWTIFLSGSDSPFGGGPQHGLANLYFQFGKYFYGGAPVLVAWLVAIVAARQRAKAVWPLASFVLMAWIGAAARIRASRTEVPGGLGHIRMEFVFWPWVQNWHESLTYASITLSLAVLPYLLWRISFARKTSS